MSLISASIDLSKVDKSKFYVHPDGRKFLEIVLMESREKKFGNDFMVVQGVSKEEREKGVRGPILGNGKWLGAKPTHTQPPSGRQASTETEANATPEDSDLPF